MPRLSIVIPVKNEEKVLPKLLDSIKAQTFKDYEIIIADAGSTDSSRDIALSYGARITSGGMPGPGRNRGAEVAEGDLIFFFDSDVQLSSIRFLEECLSEMDRKNFDVATCKVKPLSRKPIDRALHEAYNAFAITTEKIRPHAPGSCILVRRETHRGINGFDEDVIFAEDHDYAQRAIKKGFKFGLLRSHPIAVSVRRLEKDGRLASALRYVYAEMYMLTKGSIKDPLFDYPMGGEEKKP